MKISWFPPADKLQSSVQFYLKKCAAKGVEEGTRNYSLLAVFILIDLVPISKKKRESVQCHVMGVLYVLKAAVCDNQHYIAKEVVKRLTHLINPEPKFICGALC